MEFVPLEFRSSSKKHPGMKGISLERNTEEYGIQHPKKDAVTAKGKQLKEETSSDEEESSDLRALSSNQAAKRSVMDCSGSKLCCRSNGGQKLVLRPSEVEQLNKRLQALEEETELLKQALFGSIEENQKLMNEIFWQFGIAQSYFGNRLIHQKSLRIPILHTHKEGRKGSGLSQVLSQESKPSHLI